MVGDHAIRRGSRRVSFTFRKVRSTFFFLICRGGKNCFDPVLKLLNPDFFWEIKLI
jgi:hypothetical protein